MKKDYYIGLDIGTNSVGWAVTDQEYNLLKFKIRICGAFAFLKKQRLQRIGEPKEVRDVDWKEKNREYPCFKNSLPKK